MIKINNLNKIFYKNGEENHILKDINLHVEKNEIFLLKGVSGSGKSTLLSLIAGLDKPTSGEVIIGDKSISKMPEHFSTKFRRENIGIIFQNFNLIPTLSVLNNILLPTLPDKKNLHVIACELLNEFELQDKKDALAKTLSGGEAQRVAIIRALINSPSIVLCDEPTANLDKKLSLKLLEYLRYINSQNTTLIIATHDPLFLDWSFVNNSYELKK